jgi:hypothetical protein
MHENDDELSAIRQHLSQTPTEGAGAQAGALLGEGALPSPDAQAGEGALSGALPGAGGDEGVISATSIHEDDDELSAIRQHLSQTPTEGAGALPGAGVLPGALAGTGALAGADEGAMSATSIHEDDDEVFEKHQYLSAGVGTPADEGADKGALLEALAGAGVGALPATSVHEDEDDDELSLIRQHLSHTPIVGAGGLAGAGGDESALSTTNAPRSSILLVLTGQTKVS